MVDHKSHGDHSYVQSTLREKVSSQYLSDSTVFSLISSALSLPVSFYSSIISYCPESFFEYLTASFKVVDNNGVTYYRFVKKKVKLLYVVDGKVLLLKVRTLEPLRC